MLQIASLHHTQSESPLFFFRSKHFFLRDQTQIILLIGSKKESLSSILEEFFLEALGEVAWEAREVEDDFAYVSEKYNAYIRNFSSEKRDITIFFGVLIGDHFTFSLIGDITLALREPKKPWTLLSDYQGQNTGEFSHSSSGPIPRDSALYIASLDVTHILGEEVLDDFTRTRQEEFGRAVTAWCHREHLPSCEIIRIQSVDTPASLSSHTGETPVSSGYHERMYHLSTLGNRTRQTSQEFFTRIDHLFRTRPKFVQLAIFSTGLILCGMFLYILFYEIFSTGGSHTTTDSKQELIQAREYLGLAQENVGNPTVFSENVSKSEQILFKLRENQVYMKDIQDMLATISTLKKEMYGIQTFDITQHPPLVSLSTHNIEAIKAFSFNKKLYIVAKKQLVSEYIPGTENSFHTLDYPLGEEAIDADINPINGTIYILTKNNKVLTKRQNTISYVALNGQDTWEEASHIRTFNDNVYLISADHKEMYRHKPGVGNSFSAKSAIFSGYHLQSPIRDVGIDGGFFLLGENEKILRYLVGSTDIELSSLRLNGIPGDYTLSESSNTMLFIRQNLKYFYLLDGPKIWIFEPDSKKKEDIKSWTYIGQIEVSPPDVVESISVPYDGMIYITTSDGVYDLSFELSDGKLLLK